MANTASQIIESDKMPRGWSRNTTISVKKKKGDIADCSTYRPIRVTSRTLKIFERILETRLRSIIELAPNQCGFVKGCSTTDAIHTARIMIERSREKQCELHAAFLDLEKAFDKVPHDIIW